MYVHTKALTWWKSEHSEETNEDAFLSSPEQGLFIVADGVSTMLFSRMWARILVQHFANIPLSSADPFEVDWWLRQAQASYERKVPDVREASVNVQRKAREGSASTLMAVSISSVRSSSASAQMFAIGDSCILVGDEATQTVRSFPYQCIRDFDRAPVCLPSLPRAFNRSFHAVRAEVIELHAGECLLLATDAVAKWLISHEGNARWLAFQEVISQTPETWPYFIASCRAKGEMVNDDSTAIVVSMNNKRVGDILGTVPRHKKVLLEERHSHFSQVSLAHDKETMAIVYGDGQDFRGVKGISQAQIQDARAVAVAIDEIRQTFFALFYRSDMSQQEKEHLVRQVWEKHAFLLQKRENKASIERLLATLRSGEIYLDHWAAPTGESGGDTPQKEPSNFLQTLWEFLKNLVTYDWES